MQYQDHRLASYSTHYASLTTKSRSTISKSSSSSIVKWPLTFPSLDPEALAQAGFYFTPEDASDDADDQVTCFLCEKKLGGWEEGDDPLQEHAKRGDKCGWAKAVCGVLLEVKERKEKSSKGRKAKRCVRPLLVEVRESDLRLQLERIIRISSIGSHVRGSTRNLWANKRQILLVAAYKTERVLADPGCLVPRWLRLHAHTGGRRLRDVLLLLVLCRRMGGDR